MRRMNLCLRKRKKPRRETPRLAERGFSLTELVVAIAVALVLMGIGMPAFLRAYHTYQLSTAATQVAGILRLARYEAIRKNTSVNCVVKPSPSDPGMTIIWADSDKNGSQNGAEKMILLGAGGNLVDSGGVPGVANLTSTAVGAAGATPVSPTGATLQFDARGSLIPPNVNVFFLSSPASPQAGYRAVILAPAGSIGIWTGDASGVWQQVQ